MTTAATQLGTANQATTIALDALSRRGSASIATATTPEDPKLRETVGEFVGNVFYGTLMRQMEKSSIKGKYMHGGRGEEVFQSQLHMEFAKRLGRAPGDPIANRIYEAMTRSRGDASQQGLKQATGIGKATTAKRSESAQ